MPAFVVAVCFEYVVKDVIVSSVISNYYICLLRPLLEGADVPDVAPPEIVAQPPNVNVGTTSTGADSPASSDASAAKRPPTAKDEDDVDKTSPKKAHVE